MAPSAVKVYGYPTFIFSAFFLQSETNVVTSCVHPWMRSPSELGSTFKRKTLLQKGVYTFFKRDSHLEGGGGNNEKSEAASLESVPIHLKL